MSGAREAHLGLLAALTADRAAIAAAITGLRAADQGLRSASDLTDALAAGAEFLLALEALAETATGAARAAREALASTMWETGATGFRTAHHSVSVAEPRRSVVVTGDVPAEFMRQPPPAPDKHALHKALSAGQIVPGATLSNGGAPILTIRPLKESAR